MTYKKPSIEVNGTTLMGIDFSGDANAYEVLKAHKTIKAKVDSKDALIPFHAVKTFAKSVVTADAERTDPYCGGGTEPIGDCDRTDLGTLYYCGNASERLLIRNGRRTDCEAGVKVCDYDSWMNGVFSELIEDCDPDSWQEVPATGVFDGAVVKGMANKCDAITKFGDYLTLSREVDTETGDAHIVAHELKGASHYAIYVNEE